MKLTMISQLFMDFVKLCFEDDIVAREMRLSQEEKAYIEKTYPAASFKEIKDVANSDDKIWFFVTIR